MSPTAKKYLLLDSCIVEYLLDANIGTPMGNQLQIWLGKEFEPAISQVTYAELIDGANKNKVQDVKKILDSYTSTSVSQRVLSGCGYLGSTYVNKDHELKRVSMGDKIIAATSFIFNFPIVTANVKDFPHPFFTTISSENIFYKKKSKTHLVTVDVLKPNVDALKEWYSQLP